METLYDSIYQIEEGLLDTDFEDKFEQNMIAEFIEKTFKGKYKLTKDKFGGFKVRGTMILKGFTGAEMPPGFCVSTLKGNMYIENCPNLESLGNLFGELRYDDISLGRIEGTLSIADCKKFNTLKGIPSSTENLILTDLPKLKSIEFLPKYASSIMITKCGKKWTKEQIAAKSEFAKIACSFEDQNEIITESMSEPILLRTHKYLIDNKVEFDPWIRMVDSNIEIDKIRPSQVTHYKMPADKVACKKAINLMQRNNTGFAIGYEDDKLVFLANSGRCIYKMEKPYYKGGKLEFRGYHYKPASFLNEIFDQTYGNTAKVTDIYVYDVTETREAWKVRQERRDARRGMITPDDCAKIARQNRERYKKALAQLKALKASDEYIQFAKQVESRIDAYSKTIVDMIRHPEKHDATRFDMLTNYVNKMTNQFSDFVRYFKRAVMGNADSYDRIALKSKMEKCKQYLVDVDRYLSMI